MIVGILDVFIGLFTGNWSQMWNGITEIFSGIWNGITSVFSTVLEMLKEVAKVSADIDRVVVSDTQVDFEYKNGTVKTWQRK